LLFLNLESNPMSKALFWFRQDLRLQDNPGLIEARKHSELLCIYILDPKIPGRAQAWWLHHSLNQLVKSLAQKNIKLYLFRGEPQKILKTLIHEHNISAVYWNRCYEPAHIERDQQLKTWLQTQSLQVKSFNSALLNEPWTIKNQQGHYFKVFTPYWKQCLKQINIPEVSNPEQWPKNIEISSSENLESWNLLPSNPNWAQNFSSHFQPGEKGAHDKLQFFIGHQIVVYKDARDYPHLKATSNLSPHLHFGEISPWEIYRQALRHLQRNGKDEKQVIHFLSELGWREFSYHLLYHFPSLPHDNFKSEFNQFPWHDDPIALKRWQQGQTGFPIVDAGMRELWQTGTMHNRVRMIVASFLVKDLFIDWRHGAAWFDHCLLDADTASNYASWQWVAGSGADAAPYFRIFNPILQAEKFDPEGKYVKTWVTELSEVPKQWLHHPWDAPQSIPNYPKPMVNHAQARDKAMSYYQQIKKS